MLFRVSLCGSDPSRAAQESGTLSAVAGTGTMQGPDGSVFTGGWNRDVKHGLGRKVYSNGDVYEVC